MFYNTNTLLENIYTSGLTDLHVFVCGQIHCSPGDILHGKVE